MGNMPGGMGEGGGPPNDSSRGKDDGEKRASHAHAEKTSHSRTNQHNTVYDQKRKTEATNETPESANSTQTCIEHGPNGWEGKKMTRAIPRATPTWTRSRPQDGKRVSQRQKTDRTGIG